MIKHWRPHRVVKPPEVMCFDIEERAAFYELQDIIWQHGPLQSSWVETGAFVAAELRIHRLKWRAIWSRIKSLFVEVRPGEWSTEQLEIDMEADRHESESQSKRAKSRWAKHAAAMPLRGEERREEENREDPPIPPKGDRTLSLVDPEPPPLDFRSVYATYPRQLGWQKGEERAKKTIKTPAQFERFRQAVANYAAKMLQDATEERYIKRFDTFLGCWEDWVNPQQSPRAATAASSRPPVFRAGEDDYHD